MKATKVLFRLCGVVFLSIILSCAKETEDPLSKGGGAGGMEITFDTTPWAEETLFF